MLKKCLIFKRFDFIRQNQGLKLSILEGNAQIPDFTSILENLSINSDHLPDSKASD